MDGGTPIFPPVPAPESTTLVPAPESTVAAASSSASVPTTSASTSSPTAAPASTPATEEPLDEATAQLKAWLEWKFGNLRRDLERLSEALARHSRETEAYWARSQALSLARAKVSTVHHRLLRFPGA